MRSRDCEPNHKDQNGDGGIIESGHGRKTWRVKKSVVGSIRSNARLQGTEPAYRTRTRGESQEQAKTEPAKPAKARTGLICGRHRASPCKKTWKSPGPPRGRACRKARGASPLLSAFGAGRPAEIRQHEWKRAIAAAKEAGAKEVRAKLSGGAEIVIPLVPDEAPSADANEWRDE